MRLIRLREWGLPLLLGAPRRAALMFAVIATSLAATNVIAVGLTVLGFTALGLTVASGEFFTSVYASSVVEKVSPQQLDDGTNHGLGATLSMIRRIRNRGNVMVAGVPYDFAPFSYLDDDNQLTGFDVELLTSLGAEWGVKVEFVPAVSSDIPSFWPVAP